MVKKKPTLMIAFLLIYNPVLFCVAQETKEISVSILAKELNSTKATTKAVQAKAFLIGPLDGSPKHRIALLTNAKSGVFDVNIQADRLYKFVVFPTQLDGEEYLISKPINLFVRSAESSYGRSIVAQVASLNDLSKSQKTSTIDELFQTCEQLRNRDASKVPEGEVERFVRLVVDIKLSEEDGTGRQIKIENQGTCQVDGSAMVCFGHNLQSYNRSQIWAFDAEMADITTKYNRGKAQKTRDDGKFHLILPTNVSTKIVVDAQYRTRGGIESIEKPPLIADVYPTSTDVQPGVQRQFDQKISLVADKRASGEFIRLLLDFAENVGDSNKRADAFRTIDRFREANKSIDLVFCLFGPPDDRWGKVLDLSKRFPGITFWVICKPFDYGIVAESGFVEDWAEKFEPYLKSQFLGGETHRDVPRTNFRVLGYLSCYGKKELGKEVEAKNYDAMMKEVNIWMHDRYPVTGLFADNFALYSNKEQIAITDSLKHDYGQRYTICGTSSGIVDASNARKQTFEEVESQIIQSVDMYFITKGIDLDYKMLGRRFSNLKSIGGRTKLAAIELGCTETTMATKMKLIRQSQFKLIGFGGDEPISGVGAQTNPTWFSSNVSLPTYLEQLCDELQRSDNEPLDILNSLAQDEKAILNQCLEIIRGCQLQDGAFVVTKNDSQPNPAVWIQPYFANHAALALLIASEHDNSSDDLDRVFNWMAWCAKNQAKEGYWYEFEGVPGRYKSNGKIDAWDSSAALFLLVVERYSRTGRALPQNIIIAAQNALRCIRSVEDVNDGLTWAKPDYKVKYFMDNVETHAGLRAISSVFQKSGLADEEKQSRELADRIGRRLPEFWSENHQLFAYALHSDGKYDFEFSMLYPHGLAQLYGLSFVRSEKKAWDKLLLFRPEDDVKAAAGPERWLIAANQLGVEEANRIRNSVFDQASRFDSRDVYIHRPSLTLLSVLSGSNWLPEIERLKQD